MDKTDLTIIISLLAVALLVVAYFVKKHPGSISLPGFPSQPQVTVTYSTTNGEIASLTLPQQAGTTIDIPQGTSLLLSGIVSPDQVVTLYIYNSNGQLVYEQSAVADSNGQFSMVVPSTNITPGATYVVYLSLGSNYYFYVTVLAQNQLPPPTPVPCNQLIPAAIQVPNQILPPINLSANYAVNINCSSIPISASYEINNFMGSCLGTASFEQPSNMAVTKIPLFEGVVTDANGNPVCNVPLLYQFSTSVQFPISLPICYGSPVGTNCLNDYMQVSLDITGDPQTDQNGRFRVYLVMTTTLYNTLTPGQLSILCSPVGSAAVQGTCYSFCQNPIQAFIKVCVQGADGNCVASVPPAEVSTQINIYSTFSIFRNCT